MKYRQPHTLLLIILLAALFPAKAQQIAWSVDMTGFFDNREFGYSKAQSQTFFGTRLSPEIGIRIGHSTIMAGASWVQPIDGSTREAKVHPTVYYRYDTSKFRRTGNLAIRFSHLLPSQHSWRIIPVYTCQRIRRALYRLETSTDRGKTRGFHGCIQRQVATPALPFRRRAFGNESLGSSSQFG